MITDHMDMVDKLEIASGQTPWHFTIDLQPAKAKNKLLVVKKGKAAKDAKVVVRAKKKTAEAKPKKSARTKTAAPSSPRRVASSIPNVTPLVVRVARRKTILN